MLKRSIKFIFNIIFKFVYSLKSGTTGTRKGVYSTFYKFVNNALLLVASNPQSSDCIECFPASLNFIASQVMAFLKALVHPIRLVFPSFSRNLLNTLVTIQKHRCNGFLASPKFIFDMLSNEQLLASFDTSSIKYIHLGSQIVPPYLVQKSFEKFNLEYILILYGMSESLISCQYRIDSSTFKQFTSERYPVGRPIPHFEFKVVDLKDDQTIVSINTPGELLLKSFTIFNGYWNDDDKTREALSSDGWLKTGDLVYMDKDGHIYVMNRIKEVIKFGELVVFPSEVESTLRTHENVKDASVFGITHDKGIVLCTCAWIIAKDKNKKTSLEELQPLVGKQVLQHVKFVDDFPTNENSKINKLEMARLFKIELNL